MSDIVNTGSLPSIMMTLRPGWQSESRLRCELIHGPPRLRGFTVKLSTRMEFMICCLRNNRLEGFGLPVRPTARVGGFLRFAEGNL